MSTAYGFPCRFWMDIHTYWDASDANQRISLCVNDDTKEFIRLTPDEAIKCLESLALALEHCGYETDVFKPGFAIRNRRKTEDEKPQP